MVGLILFNGGKILKTFVKPKAPSQNRSSSEGVYYNRTPVFCRLFEGLCTTRGTFLRRVQQSGQIYGIYVRPIVSVCPPKTE